MRLSGSFWSFEMFFFGPNGQSAISSGPHEGDGDHIFGAPKMALSIPHRIHVWYIYLHLVDFYGKCE